MTLQARLVGDDALRVVPGGFELDIDLNWYRSLPLSCVETLELTVDGEPVARDAIAFDGHSLDELADRWNEYWFVLDPATVRVRRPLANARELKIRLGVRIPYLGHPVVYTSDRTLDLGEVVG
jgi:hypothetical protein